ncbi:MAG: DUF3494 domain-containing protein, partial [Flavobacteriales bacterium]|nr:DUF3494 domain-containing protein [Flavobacteriales bacterium]
MRTTKLNLGAVKLVHLCLISVFLSAQLIGQFNIGDENDIYNYTLYSGNGTSGASVPNPPGYGVLLSGQTSVFGNVGANDLIYSPSAVSINGDVFSDGQVYLGSFSTITGNLQAKLEAIAFPPPPETPDRAVQIGGNFNMTGDIRGNGRILIGDTSEVQGTVYLPPNSNYFGPSPSGGVISAPVEFEALPTLPEVSEFAPFGTQDITQDGTIQPGSYKKLKLAGQKKVTFDGPGVYTFKSIKNSGKTNQLKFDFKNDPTGSFVIHVHGDMNFGKIRVKIVNGGEASRIYFETHGTGNSQYDGTYSAIINNGNETYNTESTFRGRIYAPYGGIFLGKGEGFSYAEGTFWSGTQVCLNPGVFVEGVEQFLPCQEGPFASAGPDQQIDCDNPTTILEGIESDPGLEYLWTTADGNILSGSESLTPEVDQGGTYILTVTDPQTTCSSSDTVLITEDFTVPFVDAGPDQELGCGYNYLILEGEFEGDIGSLTFDWTSPDGDFNGSKAPWEIFPTTTGTFIFTVTLISNGCSASDTVLVTEGEYTGPIADAGSDLFIDCGDVLFVEGMADGEVEEFFWYSDDGDYFTYEGDPFIEIYSGGTYILEVYDEGGCFDSDTLIVFETGISDFLIVDAGPPKILNCAISETILEGDYFFDYEEEGEFGSQPEDEGNIEWNTPDGNIVSGQFSLNPVVNEPGTYYLTVFEYETGCSATDSTIVTFEQCIIPYYPPLPEGKVDEIIGSELTSLALNFEEETDTISQIFRIINDSVFIEVITLEGQTAIAK